MDKSLMSLIETTDNELKRADQALWPEGEDYSSFCRHAETLTDLLIQALFPRHASDAVSRRGTLREAVLHLEACLSHLYPDSPQITEIIATLLKGLPEVRRQLQTDLKLVASAAGDECARQIDKAPLDSLAHLGRKLLPGRIQDKVFQFVCGFVFHDDLFDFIRIRQQRAGRQGSASGLRI